MSEKNINNLKIVGTTLLSLEEANVIYESVRKNKEISNVEKECTCEYCGRMYIRGTVSICPGCGATIPTYHEETNDSNSHAEFYSLLHPALKIDNLESSGFEIGDTFEFGKQTYRIISKNIACYENDFNDTSEVNKIEKTNVFLCHKSTLGELPPLT